VALFIVDMTPGKHPPTASFTYAPPTPRVNDSVTFDASASEPGFNGTHDAPIANYTWDFNDTTIVTVTDPKTTHKFTQEGNYTVTLTVKDTQGWWSTTSKTIEVVLLPPAYGPTAIFDYEPEEPFVGETVTFNASLSVAGWNGTAEKPITSYKWDFGDANTTMTTNPVITHKYTTSGTFTVNLTVTAPDAMPKTDSTRKTITIAVPPDTTAPTIADVDQSPPADEVDPDEDVTVTAINVTDNVAVDKVLLNYTIENVTHIVAMSKVSGANNYTGEIPGQAADIVVKYRVFANDTSGNYYKTSEYKYTVKKAVPPPFPWLWIVVGVVVVAIIIAAVYMLRRKKPA